MHAEGSYLIRKRIHLRQDAILDSARHKTTAVDHKFVATLSEVPYSFAH
jgi:hypothetical protein